MNPSANSAARLIAGGSTRRRRIVVILVVGFALMIMLLSSSSSDGEFHWPTVFGEFFSNADGAAGAGGSPVQHYTLRGASSLLVSSPSRINGPIRSSKAGVPIGVGIVSSERELVALRDICASASSPFKHWIIAIRGKQVDESTVMRKTQGFCPHVFALPCPRNGVSSCMNAAIQNASKVMMANHGSKPSAFTGIGWMIVFSRWPLPATSRDFDVSTVTALLHLPSSHLISSVSSKPGDSEDVRLANMFQQQHFMASPNTGFVVGSDYDTSVFLVHGRVFDSVGLFDENMLSSEGGQFCVECVELMWRAQLHPTNPLRRRMLPQRLVPLRANPIPELSHPPPEFDENHDYLQLKFGQSFLYELTLPRPPSRWTMPFNSDASESAVVIVPLDEWRRDDLRLACIEKQLKKAGGPTGWCWYDGRWITEQFALKHAKRGGVKKSSSSSSSSETVRAVVAAPAHFEILAAPHKFLRPGQWFMRQIRMPYGMTNEFPRRDNISDDVGIDEKAPPGKNTRLDWLDSIEEHLRMGAELYARDAQRFASSSSSSSATLHDRQHYDPSVMPAIVSLLYTDCYFQRTMLGSIKVPVRRLVIAWNGLDTCAAETVELLRRRLSKSVPGALALAHFPSNRGFGAAFNGGWLTAYATASMHNEPNPAWALVSNGDIQYDDTLRTFVREVNTEVRKPRTNLGFFFGAGVSFCAVPTSHLVLQHAGLLDENFKPSYSEDIDYLWRAGLAGINRKHFAWKFGHRNGGSYHGKNRTAVSNYIAAMTRGDTKNYCSVKWGLPSCLDLNVWTHIPISKWIAPYGAIGIPPAYWKLDMKRVKCIDGGGGPVYLSSPACYFDGTVVLDDFPDAVLPRHVMAPPRELATKDLQPFKPPVFESQSSWLPDVARLLAVPASSESAASSSSSPSIGIVVHLSGASYGSFKPLVHDLVSSGIRATVLVGVFDSVTTPADGGARDKLAEVFPRAVSFVPVAPTAGMAQSLNHGIKQAERLAELQKQAAKSSGTGNNNNHNQWILFITHSAPYSPDVIARLVAATTSREVVRGGAGIIQTADLSHGVMLVNIGLLNRKGVGIFDENMATLDVGGGTAAGVGVPLFCCECVDLIWRAALAGVPRHVIDERLLPFRRQFIGTPGWQPDNADYLVLKWGHSFPFEYMLPKPPSGWTRPFNNSAVPLSMWKEDKSRRGCLTERFSRPMNDLFLPSPLGLQFCHTDLVWAAPQPQQDQQQQQDQPQQQYFHHALTSSPYFKPQQEADVKKLLRPSFYFNRYLTSEAEFSKEQEQPAFGDLPERNQDTDWIHNVVKRVRDAHQPIARPLTVPAFVVLLYTDCIFFKRNLQTLNNAIHTLHVVVSATADPDVCVADAVALLKRSIPSEYLHVTHIGPVARGIAAAYNAGWRSALSLAARRGEPPPLYVFFTHADIYHDETLPPHVRFIESELQHEVCDAGFFFNGATSMCSVGITTLALQRTGFLDENFVTGFHDADYIWRVHFGSFENKHNMAYVIHHENGGATKAHPRSSAAARHSIDINSDWRMREEPQQLCVAKWGDLCKDGKQFTVHFPLFQSPFNVSGSALPPMFWKLDAPRLACITQRSGADANTAAMGGPTYLGSPVCYFSATPWRDEYPHAKLPRHVSGLPRQLPISDLSGRTTVLEVGVEWTAETLAMFEPPKQQAQQDGGVLMISHVQSDERGCYQEVMVPMLAAQTKELQFSGLVVTASAEQSACAAKMKKKIEAAQRQNSQQASSSIQFLDFAATNTSSFRGIGASLNAIHRHFSSSYSSPQQKPTWYLFISKWAGLSSGALQRLVKEAERISRSSGDAVAPAATGIKDSDIVFLQGSDFDISVFMMHSRVFDLLGDFDENVNSFEGGNFASEVFDMMWRAKQSGLHRKIVPHTRIYAGDGGVFAASFTPAPAWHHDNSDVMMARWGHFYLHELTTMLRPPSKWTRPFNCSDLTFKESWRLDSKRIECLKRKFDPKQTDPAVMNNRSGAGNWCWYDARWVAEKLNNVAGATNDVPLPLLQPTVLRPSLWYKRFVEPWDHTPLSQLKYTVPPGDAAALDAKYSDWLPAVRKALRRGREVATGRAFLDQNETSSYLPALVSLLFTDCDLQRKMMGSLLVPIGRLIIGWNGDDECAAETVNVLRTTIPVESLGVVWFQENRGFAASFNGGMQMAARLAALHDEPPPLWVIITNGDIQYDTTLADFARFINHDLSNPASNSGLYFGPGVSYCTIAQSFEALERAGHLDENFYPAYSEDISAMWSIHLAGMQNRHFMTYKFDHVNGGTYRGKNKKLVSAYVGRMARGDTKNYCHNKWSGPGASCSGTNVWSHYPLSGWTEPFNSSGLPSSYWKIDRRRIRCIDNRPQDDGQPSATYVNSHVCFYNTSVMLEDFPDVDFAEHATWKHTVVLPSVRWTLKH